MNKAVMVVSNTKSGLAALKYLANEIVQHRILVQLVSKKEFDTIVKGDLNA
jgi:hypothetical protein